MYTPNLNTQFEHNQLINLHCVTNLSEQVSKFWEVVDFQQMEEQTYFNDICEAHFIQIHQHNANGQYVVRLPFKTELDLGNTRQSASCRLLQVEKRLTEQQLQQYRIFMTEYISLQHLTKLNTARKVDCVYLPHHAIFKDTSDTTKIRVLFDASCKSSNGKSLNDLIAVGPTVQDDLFSI